MCGPDFSSFRTFSLASDLDLLLLFFCREISIEGSKDSSPPSPMISGGVCTNPTVSPFRLFGRPLARTFVWELAAPAARTSCALGQRRAIEMLSLGLGFSVDGLRKSTTFSSSLKVSCRSDEPESASLDLESLDLTSPNNLRHLCFEPLDAFPSSSAITPSTASRILDLPKS